MPPKIAKNAPSDEEGIDTIPRPQFDAPKPEPLRPPVNWDKDRPFPVAAWRLHPTVKQGMGLLAQRYADRHGLGSAENVEMNSVLYEMLVEKGIISRRPLDVIDMAE